MEKITTFQKIIEDLMDETAREKVLFLISTVLIGLFINIIAAGIVRFILRW